MDKNGILKKLADAVLNGDSANVENYTREAVESGVDPMEAVEKGLSVGMKIIGDRFEGGKIFLPEMLGAADTFNRAMEVLKPVMKAQEKRIVSRGKVVIATVKGDVHSIGKNIVATVLETGGFEVVDIGVDRQSLGIIETAEKQNADVIALSALMTTTMPAQKEVIDILNEMGMRNRFFIIVGGGPVNSEWAKEIGADGYGETAFHAVQLIGRLLQSGS